MIRHMRPFACCTTIHNVYLMKNESDFLVDLVVLLPTNAAPARVRLWASSKKFGRHPVKPRYVLPDEPGHERLQWLPADSR